MFEMFLNAADANFCSFNLEVHAKWVTSISKLMTSNAFNE